MRYVVVTFTISEQQTAHPAGFLILAGDLKHAELKYQYYQIYTSMLIFQQTESEKNKQNWARTVWKQPAGPCSSGHGNVMVQMRSFTLT